MSLKQKSLAVLLIALVPSILLAYDGKHLYGKAVSCLYPYGDWQVPNTICGESEGGCFPDGSICVYTIGNSKITHADTIYSRFDGLAVCPTFNMSGTKIVFIRENIAPSASGGACQTTNGGKTTVSVINTDGTGLDSLCSIPLNAGVPLGGINTGDFWNIMWPAGEWIYYQICNPVDGHKTSEIWKVNATTKQKAQVCNYGNGSYSFRRFSVNLAATYMAVEKNDGAGGNAMYPFPSSCPFTAASIGSNPPGCNTAISPSGDIVCNYQGGAHWDLFLKQGPTQASPGNNISGRDSINLHLDLEGWSSEVFSVTNGGGAENPRWSVNSDKWVLQEIGWISHASDLRRGSNSVAANWVDRVAINISHIPLNTNDNTLKWNSTTGTLWVADSVNNPLNTKYEDLQGVWHEVAGALPIVNKANTPEYFYPPLFGSSGIIFPRHEATIKNAAPLFQITNRLLKINTQGVVYLRVATLQGKTIFRTAITATSTVSLTALSVGSYVASVTQNGLIHSQAIMIR